VLPLGKSAHLARITACLCGAQPSKKAAKQARIQRKDGKGAKITKKDFMRFARLLDMQPREAPKFLSSLRCLRLCDLCVESLLLPR
jgi:hypothetical protein